MEVLLKLKEASEVMNIVVFKYGNAMWASNYYYHCLRM